MLSSIIVPSQPSASSRSSDMISSQTHEDGAKPSWVLITGANDNHIKVRFLLTNSQARMTQMKIHSSGSSSALRGLHRSRLTGLENRIVRTKGSKTASLCQTAQVPAIARRAWILVLRL